MAQQPRHSKKRQEKKEEIEEESISIFSKDFFKENKKTIICLCVVLVVFGGIVGGLYAYSGVSPPFSVINSGSMQHSDKSQIGVIDTGDMVYVKNPNSKSITTYVEGSNCGYSKFGDYGDVIVYITETRNIS